MARVKITVLKTMFHQDLVDDYLKNEAFKKHFGACLIFEEGQEFISDGWPSVPGRVLRTRMVRYSARSGDGDVRRFRSLDRRTRIHHHLLQ